MTVVFKIGGGNINKVFFVDDSVLIDENANDIQAVVIKPKEDWKNMTRIKYKKVQNNDNNLSNLLYN